MRLTFTDGDGVVHRVRFIDAAVTSGFYPQPRLLRIARCGAERQDVNRIDLDSASRPVTCERCAKEGR